MPSKTKSTRAGATPELEVPKEFLDQLVKGPMTQGNLESMFRSLKKAVIERAMHAEMSEDFGYDPGQPRPAGKRNHRNGASPETVITDEDPCESKCHATVRPASRRGSSASTSAASPVSTRRSLRRRPVA